MIRRRCGAALTALCRGGALLLGLPHFPRAHALLLGLLVAAGPLLRGRGDPRSVLATPHNRLEARLVASAAAWTWLLIGSLLVASHPWLRPPLAAALRALARLAVGLALSRAGHALGHALEAATGSCRQATPLGTLLLPLGDPASCRGAGHSWEGFGPAPQAFALVHCGLGLAEEAAALGRRLYGRGKMAAAGHGAEEVKAAAGYGVEGSKMAAGHGVEGSKMAAGYGVEGSKMAAGYGMEGAKMAGGHGFGEGFKMAARYGAEGSRMAARYGREESKMAAGYGLEEESKMATRAKMAASGGWAWPRPTWRPTWAEPAHGWGSHLESPGGHFDGRRSPYGGGHFEHQPGRHLERRGGHFDGRRSPYGGGHFEEGNGGHLERRGGHLERISGHFEGGPFEPHPGGHLERYGGHVEHRGGHLERYGGHLERYAGHFEPPSGHFEPPGSHFEPRLGRFFAAERLTEGGHLGEAPPLALSVLYLLALALLVTWHLLLVVTLTYRNTWARNAAGAALGWAAWAVTYRGWYRRAWSPGPPGWG